MASKVKRQTSAVGRKHSLHVVCSVVRKRPISPSHLCKSHCQMRAIVHCRSNVLLSLFIHPASNKSTTLLVTYATSCRIYGATESNGYPALSRRRSKGQNLIVAHTTFCFSNRLGAFDVACIRHGFSKIYFFDFKFAIQHFGKVMYIC